LKFVENANRSQLVFFENITHELRTPIHGILNFSRFGMESRFSRDNPDKITEYFRNIHSSASRLMHMILNLLELSAFESNDVSMDYSRISVFAVVLQVYEEMKPVFVEKNVRFFFEKPGFDTAVEIDRKKISLAVKHILGNALRHSPPESEIRLDLVDADEMLTVSISDQGPGVPDDMLTRVFDRFVDFDDPQEKTRCGFGLSICREIVKLHCGWVSASNLPMQGFVLTFTIPKTRVILGDGGTNVAAGVDPLSDSEKNR
jgi:signal transduction histidine kinase